MPIIIFIFVWRTFFFILAEIAEFHVAGVLEGLTQESGRLKPEEAGAFHIYAQVFFESYSEAPEYHNRVALAVNGVTFSIMQTGLGGKADYGSLTTGGVIYLQKGDHISLVALYDSHILMQGDHTFFGAFRISE